MEVKADLIFVAGMKLEFAIKVFYIRGLKQTSNLQIISYDVCFTRT